MAYFSRRVAGLLSIKMANDKHHQNSQISCLNKSEGSHELHLLLMSKSLLLHVMLLQHPWKKWDRPVFMGHGGQHIAAAHVVRYFLDNIERKHGRVEDDYRFPRMALPMVCYRFGQMEIHISPSPRFSLENSRGPISRNQKNVFLGGYQVGL